MKILALVSILLCGGVLLYVTDYFPVWGDPASPASLHISPHYIQGSLKDTAVPNIVTAVLADYRGYDTMFETSVILAAGIACFFILRVSSNRRPDAKLYRHIPTGITLRIEKGGREPLGSTEFERIDFDWVPYDLIINMTCRLVVPFIQLFALYVIAHGHHSPGGGFQGGVIFGAAIILFAIANNLRQTVQMMSEKISALLSAFGVIVYVGTGAVCLMLGGNFLDYAALSPVLGVDAVHARSLGIFIVEMGVGIAVTAVMVWIYYNLSSAGRQDEGL